MDVVERTLLANEGNITKWNDKFMGLVHVFALMVDSTQDFVH